MKPFRYWRMVQYTDDGCAVYQCLACKTDWESRSSSDRWRYCPRCGVEWVGEHECVEHGCRMHEICERHGRDTSRAVYPQWIVQEKVSGPGGGIVRDWYNESYEMKHREQALAYKRERESAAVDNWLSLQYEYRIVRWYPSPQSREGRAIPAGEATGEAMRWLAEECKASRYGRHSVELRCERFDPPRPLAVYPIGPDGVKRIDKED